MRSFGPAKWLFAWSLGEWVSVLLLYLNLQFSIFGSLTVTSLMLPSFGVCVGHALATMRLADPLRAPMREDNLTARLSLAFSVPFLMFIVFALCFGIRAQAEQKGWSQDAELLLQFIMVVIGVQALSALILVVYRNVEPADRSDAHERT